ncbi:UNVERIFIED_CONTAM: hypothetical protein Q9R58_04930 [Methylobacteriaceae bacterium AG10]|nr:hypothetical protein [Methylobacteriaceae bacterium AG10]
MVAAEGATASDARLRADPPRFARRRGRIQPGPLKPLDRRSRRPVWAVYAGLLGLSLVTTWAIAPQIRTGTDVAEQSAPASMAEPVQEAAQSVRIIGAVQAPQAAPADESAPAVEVPLPTSAAELSVEPPPAAPVAAAPAVPAAKRATAPTVDLGVLPVLTLDETAFDGLQAPVSEPTPRVAVRTQGRP